MQVGHAVGFRVIVNHVRSRRSQRADRDRTGDEKETFVHRNSEPRSASNSTTAPGPSTKPSLFMYALLLKDDRRAIGRSAIRFSNLAGYPRSLRWPLLC